MENKLIIAGYETTITYDDAQKCNWNFTENGSLVTIDIELTSETPMRPSFKISWDEPDVDMQARFVCSHDFKRAIMPDWGGKINAYNTNSAPVYSVYNQIGKNRLTFGISDTLSPVELICGVHEEDAMMGCRITTLPGPGSEVTKYNVSIWIDRRDVPTYTALADITKWWETFPGNEPAAVPEVARCPMYSTWYSFHQATIPSEILAELRLAKEMGCSAVIVDDGWQTDDMLRGYASCGVWQVAASKIPDMRQFVADVHALGMKFLLWYSVPFIGTETEAWKTFGTMVLEENPENTACLDPRFKEVREYLIGIYERALIDWDLDGFKLDFVDSYSNFYESLRPDPRHDIPDLSVAVDRLLKDVLARLRAIKPDIMIEFRQNYVGPLMRTYGNMFRASDCPNDALTNRRRIADVRLLSGNTATHSDMMMWHKDEPVEVAALQYNNIFFSVPQISVMIRSIPEDHRKMLKYYTQFWNENRDVLLDGEFRPYNPELSYPVITGVTADKQLSCAYALNAVSIDPNPNTVILVNATGFPYMIVDAPKSQWDVTVTDCMGNVISTDTITLDGIAKLDIPLSGIMTAKKK